MLRKILLLVVLATSSFFLAATDVATEDVATESPTEVLYQENYWFSSNPRVLFVYKKMDKLPEKAEYSIQCLPEDNFFSGGINPQNFLKILEIVKKSKQTSVFLNFHDGTKNYIELYFGDSDVSAKKKFLGSKAEFLVKFFGAEKPSKSVIKIFQQAGPEGFIGRNFCSIAGITTVTLAAGGYLSIPAIKRRRYEKKEVPLINSIKRFVTTTQKNLELNNDQVCFRQATTIEKTLWFFGGLKDSVKKIYDPTWQALESGTTSLDVDNIELIVIHAPTRRVMRDLVESIANKTVTPSAQYKYIIVPLDAFNPPLLFEPFKRFDFEPYEYFDPKNTCKNLNALVENNWNIIVINPTNSEYGISIFNDLNGYIQREIHNQNTIRRFWDYTLPNIVITGKNFPFPDKFDGKMYFFEKIVKRPTAQWTPNIKEVTTRRTDHTQSPEDFLFHQLYRTTVNPAH